MPGRTRIRAVVFDIGGVLERVDSPAGWLGSWQRRLGVTEEELAAMSAAVDRAGQPMVGDVTEAELRRRYADALGLSEHEADEFMADLWDWYCGELDTDLMSYAASLRPAYATAILSNSGPGAREQEESRYGFAAVFDPIVYSHEVGMMKPDPRIYALTCELLGAEPPEVVLLDDWQVSVDAAHAVGWNAVRHERTADSIHAIDALLRGS